VSGRCLGGVQEVTRRCLGRRARGSCRGLRRGRRRGRPLRRAAPCSRPACRPPLGRYGEIWGDMGRDGETGLPPAFGVERRSAQSGKVDPRSAEIRRDPPRSAEVGPAARAETERRGCAEVAPRQRRPPGSRRHTRLLLRLRRILPQRGTRPLRRRTPPRRRRSPAERRPTCWSAPPSGDMGRCGEIWAAYVLERATLGRYGEIWGDMGRYGRPTCWSAPPSGDMGRCGEIWGDMGPGCGLAQTSRSTAGRRGGTKRVGTAEHRRRLKKWTPLARQLEDENTSSASRAREMVEIRGDTGRDGELFRF